MDNMKFHNYNKSLLQFLLLNRFNHRIISGIKCNNLWL